jgi:NADPH-dependent stearoyl-CoA 9-desaturase
MSLPMLTREEAVARIRAIGREARAAVGAADVRLAKRLKATTRIAELAGRLLLHFVPGPLGLVAGTVALTYHYAIEAQLNHSVMHGAYRGLAGAERLDPSCYETLAVPFQSKTWGLVHHIHHKHPSLLGADPDTIHPLTRVHRDDPWRPWHALNLVLGFVFVFECWAFDYDRFLKSTGRRARRDRSEWRKLASYGLYNYVLFPLLAGPRWKEVLAGCVLATLGRNLVFVVLQTASSVGRRISSCHDRDDGPKRGVAWLRFQVETSKNFVLRGLWRILCGGLDRHIEHHLFPDLPPSRLHAISADVRRICRAAGIDYEEHRSVWSSLRDSAAHLRRLSVPRR